MEPRDLAFAGAARQAELVRAREVSARELVELSLSRIAELDPQLNAFRVVSAERALRDAGAAQRRLDAGEDGPLLGVPVAVKDDLDVAGDLTAEGTAPVVAPADADADVVRRLRAAGAVVVGKTNVPELTQWPFTESATWGVTRNPWDLQRTPGGSSGGSAAAVAAGLVPVALGSDGAGSIRIPAACCGLFGLKAQRGRVSLAPDAERWHGMVVVGPLTRSVLDSALLHDVLADRAPERPFAQAAVTPPGRLRIAISTKTPLPATPLDDEVVHAVHDTADLLRSLGHEVVQRDPDYGTSFLDVAARYLRGIHDEAARVPRPDLLERRTRGMSRLGALVTPRLLARARAAEPATAARLNALLADHDMLITPMNARPPVPVGHWEGRGALWTFNGVARFTPFAGTWNVTGQPAAAVPAGLDARGLPLAVQLVGRPHDEATVFSLAAQIEAQRPWATVRPPVS